jgi:hypothetical protein
MKAIVLLKKWCPALMVVIITLNLIVNYNNGEVFNAYLIALFGWLVIAVDELFPLKHIQG